MKLITKGTIAGALMLLMVPAAAMAGPAILTATRSRRMNQLPSDAISATIGAMSRAIDTTCIATWPKAAMAPRRAQEADIRHDLADIRGDQFALRHEYRGYPYR